MRRHAFTLIEMLVVVGIIGLLLSIGVPALMNAARRADMYATLNIVSNIHATMSQVAKTETGSRHVRFGYSISALGVKPFFQCWASDAPGAKDKAFSLASDEYNNYIFQISNTSGRNLVGKSYDWVRSRPGGLTDLIVFEDRMNLGLHCVRVGIPSTLPPTMNRLDPTTETAYEMWYDAAPASPDGYQSAPTTPYAPATLSIQFEPGTGFTEAMIGLEGIVKERGTCAEMYLFPTGIIQSMPIALNPTVKPRFKIYIHPNGNLQISNSTL